MKWTDGTTTQCPPGHVISEHLLFGDQFDPATHDEIDDLDQDDLDADDWESCDSERYSFNQSKSTCQKYGLCNELDNHVALFNKRHEYVDII